MKNILDKYCRNSGELTIRLYHHLIRPAKIDCLDRILYYNESTERILQEAAELIEMVKAYQAELFERYREISQTNYCLVLSIRRTVQSDNRKTYTVEIYKKYDAAGIQNESVFKETFFGSERAKAFRLFEKLKKERPNIQTENITAKAKWEK